MTITRTFEVVITRKIRVNLPDEYGSEEMLAGWECGLWQLDNGVEGMAAYAARLVADGSAEYNNDGVVRMVDEVIAEMRLKRGEELAPLTVTYRVLENEMDTTMVDD
jgi:hypothetical protein